MRGNLWVWVVVAVFAAGCGGAAATDAGSLPEDATDAGPLDAGEALDAGARPADAGAQSFDAGVPPADAGVEPSDAGAQPSDGGAEPVDAGGNLPDAGPAPCAADFYVLSGACVACAPGKTRPAGDDPSGPNTSCSSTVCAADTHVAAHQCVACAAGTTNLPGDDASGADSACDGSRCASNFHVVSNACVACVPGSTRLGGDDPAGADTACLVTSCVIDQFVSNHTCVSCSRGTTRLGGDDATGVDTSCVSVLCGSNEHVTNHACTTCTAGTERAAGDPAEGVDTSCSHIACAANQFVQGHVCTACPALFTRAAGDDASGADTGCTPASFDWAPKRSTALWSDTEAITVTFSEDLPASSLSALGGSLGALAQATWVDARTLRLVPTTRWAVGPGTLTFSVADRFGNPTAVLVSGTVIDAVYADVLTGDDANPGTAVLPLRTVALAIARARDLGPEFPVFAALATAGAAASLDVGASNFEDLHLTCTGAGRLLVSAAGVSLRSTSGRQTRLSGCGFSGSAVLSVTGGSVLLRDTLATRVELTAGQLALESSLAVAVTQVTSTGAQYFAQFAAGEVRVSGGTASLTNVLLNRLVLSAGAVVADNTGVFQGVLASGGALTYRGGFVGQAANGAVTVSAANSTTLPIGVELTGAASGATHELDGVEIIARTSVMAHALGAPFAVSVHDAALFAGVSGAGLDGSGSNLWLLRTRIKMLDAWYGVFGANGTLEVARCEIVDLTPASGGRGVSTSMLQAGSLTGSTISGVLFGVEQNTPAGSFLISGNTISTRANGLGVVLGGLERVEHNLIIGSDIGVAMDNQPNASGRWNHFSNTNFATLDLAGHYETPDVWVGNTEGGSAFLDARFKPSAQTPCVAMRTAAVAADLPLLASLTDLVGAPRTLPFSAGAWESDGSCGCLANQRVQAGACVACASGATNSAGNDMTGPDTQCSGTLCAADQRVFSHACVSCAAGTTNAAGDDASGADSACDITRCVVNQSVASHVCVACPAGSVRAAGDDASANDTACTSTLCLVNQHVVNHACVPCSPGSVSFAGHAAVGEDTQCFVPTAAQSETLAAGVSAYWPLDEQGAPAWDLITPLKATAFGPAQFARPALVGTGVVFNGDSYLEAPFGVGANPTGSFTVEFWMESTGLRPTFQAPVTSRGNGTGYGFYVSPSNASPANTLMFWVGSGVAWNVLLGPVVVPGQRLHVAGAFDALTTELRLTVNGVLVATQPNALVVPNTNRPFRIGAGTTEGIANYLFNGLVDEVSVYPRALSTSALAARYASMKPPSCGANLRVAAHACVACATGYINAPGDEPSLSDTVCDPWVCAQNEYVSGNRCVACATGTVNEPGDDARGADTACYGSCPANQHVVASLCVACPPGSTNAPGDLVTLANTACDPTLCAINQSVLAHACVACVPGATRPAGDNAMGADTSCAPTVCGANFHVVNNTCTACPLYTYKAAGDVATSPDTDCYDVVCAAGQHVVNQACVACPPCQVAGGAPWGGDTACVTAPGVSYVQGVLTDGPKAYWQFDEPSGWAFDSMTGLEAVPQGGALLGAPGLVSGTAANLPGAWLATPPIVLSSVEFWFRQDDPSGMQGLFDWSTMYSTPFSNGLALAIFPNGLLQLSVYTGQYNPGRDVFYGPRLEPHVRHQVVVTTALELTNSPPYYRTRIKLFTDGVLMGNWTETYYQGGRNALRWGTFPSYPPPLFNGVIDESATYDRALTDQEVALHYALAKAPAAAGSCGALCGINQRVSAHACVACGPSSTNAAGNDPAGFDTQCAPVTCAAGQFVSNHVCVSCAGGTSRPAGDPVSGPDTVCASATGPYSARVQASGASANWRLDEASGALVDQLGGPSGAPQGVVDYGRTGLVAPGTALQFSQRSYVEVPWSVASNPTGSYSVEFWFQASRLNANFASLVAARNDDLSGYNFYVTPFVNGNHLEFWTGDGALFVAVTGPTIEVGRRSHVVGTYSATTNVMTLFVDGESVAARSVVARANGLRPLRIGAGTPESTPRYFFDGLIDELAVYPSALSPIEVREHFVTGALQH